jgi:hypothetical protein
MLVLWIVVPAIAWAGPTPKVFPLTAPKGLPAELEGAPERLTQVIARMADGKVSEGPISSAASAAGCTINDSGCLEQIARASRVQELVFGTVRVGDDQRVFVKVTRFIAGTERRERTFVLTAETPAALGKQLARAAREMFDLAPLAEEDEPRPAPEPRRRKTPKEQLEQPGKRVEGGRREKQVARPEDGPTDVPIDQPAPTSRGRITRGTYFLIAGGVMTAAVGTGLLIAGAGLSADAARAKQTTPDDKVRIAAIERAARLRSTSGTVLLVGGGLALAGGIVRAFYQRRQVDPDRDRAVSLVPVEGGAAVVFSGRLP